MQPARLAVGRRALAAAGPSYVCQSCRAARSGGISTRRPYSSASHPPAPAAGAAYPPASGVAALPSRRLISVSGPDAASYLQGVVTRSTTDQRGHPVDLGSGVYGAFLNPQGRVLHDVFIYPDTLLHRDAAGGGSSYLIEVDADQVDLLQRNIRRYKLRAKFAVRAVAPDEVAVWHAWDDGAASSGTSSAAAALLSHAHLGPDELRHPDARAPGLGQRVLTARAARPRLDLPDAGEQAYAVRRYLRGVAEGQDELPRESALPHESNMDVMGGVDWHKGCYVGQELTIRTRHRGVVRKRVLPCAIYDEHAAAPAALAYHHPLSSSSPTAGSGTAADNGNDQGAAAAAAVAAEEVPCGTSIGRVGKKGRSAGKWLKGVGNVGLALCRLEVMTDVELPGETAASGAYDPSGEFVMHMGGEDQESRSVRIKAFVPDWLRSGLQAQAIR
ncbi:uncharacterized protein E0L32_011559 [Thyridium curvatum]|uniref:Iron-sulfur cluster assembly factor IBA57 homolog, mitochondrial n=1 Tax=Thyridium curvatum TaxID=1093900 RepID=A0A507BMS7_9PEZI|nr:uncharacterized protein E0L32_011559 [Thyridium curvatum]TPX18521.1 hypothetical protein E0L32_011559 [Thyridium curvatum]